MNNLSNFGSQLTHITFFVSIASIFMGFITGRRTFTWLGVCGLVASIFYHSKDYFISAPLFPLFIILFTTFECYCLFKAFHHFNDPKW
ncbi:hypothetical protein P8822_00285 [Bacillus sonorensis]|uniref:hypothetical protein n=1 Tax=Bacillus subtilis group TaxID=653685 RepID=UPI001FD71AE3|nr:MULTISPECIES: hypothetical protein [Bacillus subtilis group]MCJ8223684.1 hypothetical protein [Bacillus paralicheniformis]MEC0526251.1 hypothetical protein [Bacillus sonorensis]